MEGIVYTIKQAYSGNRVNIATWDSDLELESMKCCGLSEFGTARSGNDLEYGFAVFRGAGEIKWKGEIWLRFARVRFRPLWSCLIVRFRCHGISDFNGVIYH